jgi:hypothetical protein
VDPDPEKRLSMKEITVKLKEITAMMPDEAIPKPFLLWWAELTITSNHIP